MTDQQKQRIINLRAEGKQYKEIAGELGLSLGCVKMFMSRRKEEKPKCEQCGKKLRQDILRPARRFCSDRCRMKWWDVHPERMERGTQFQMWKLWKSFLFTEDKEVLFPFMLLQITEARWMNQRKTFDQDRTSHPDRFLYLSKPAVLGIANGRVDRSTEKVKKTCHRYLPVVQLGFKRK